MTTKTELQTMVEAMPDEYPDLECDRAYGPLEIGQKYWTFSSTAYFSYTWVGDSVDRVRLELGQVFLTEKAAKDELRKRKLWQQRASRKKGINNDN